MVRAGWLHLGVGSAAIRKVLIRVQGPTAAPEDDEVLEVKEVTNLEGVGCVEGRATPPGVRIIDGSRQLGRLKHEILAVGPTLLIAATAGRGEHWLDWLISSWEPSYRELRIVDLRSATDLADIAFDAGVQLGAGKSRLRAAAGAGLGRETRGQTPARDVDHCRRTARRMAGAADTMRRTLEPIS